MTSELDFKHPRARNVALVQDDQGGQAAPLPEGVGLASVEDIPLPMLPLVWEVASWQALDALQRDQSHLTHDWSRLFKSRGILR